MMTSSKDRYVILANLTVQDAIEFMNRNLVKAVVVVDSSDVVLGLFSNGDMRSFFLKGGSLTSSITEAMNYSPRLFRNEEEIKNDLENGLRIIYPIVDNARRLLGVVDPYDAKETSPNKSLANVPLVINAGGKGTRLYPYTKILPKPLIPIGDLTITERIIHNFSRFGTNDVHMILNYKANMIKAYFQDIDKTYALSFYDEESFRGTAGGLRLLKNAIRSTFFFTNCDILVTEDLECVFKTHKNKGNAITIVCAMKNYVIPYGIIETDADGNVETMKEKPDLSFLVNTGLYVLEPEVISLIGKDEFIHMPDLAKRCIQNGMKVGVFPVSESKWMDMGQIQEMEKMMKALRVDFK